MVVETSKKLPSKSNNETEALSSNVQTNFIAKKKKEDGVIRIAIVGGSFSGLAFLRQFLFNISKLSPSSLICSSYELYLIEPKEYFEYTPAILKCFINPTLPIKISSGLSEYQKNLSSNSQFKAEGIIDSIQNFCDYSFLKSFFSYSLDHLFLSYIDIVKNYRKLYLPSEKCKTKNKQDKKSKEGKTTVIDINLQSIQGYVTTIDSRGSVSSANDFNSVVKNEGKTDEEVEMTQDNDSTSSSFSRSFGLSTHLTTSDTYSNSSIMVDADFIILATGSSYSTPIRTYTPFLPPFSSSIQSKKTKIEKDSGTSSTIRAHQNQKKKSISTKSDESIPTKNL